ncbi:MAG TPA: glycosyltransferase [Acidimicrobiales bacterium]|nr:glycosyltransferase [Acidimicrobiales bacterium]
MNGVRTRERTGHAIVVLNLPVPDDRRVWAQAVALRDVGTPVHVLCPAMHGHRPGHATVDGIHVRYLRTFEGRGLPGVAAEGLWNTVLCLTALPALLRLRLASLQVCNPPDTLFPMLVLARLAGLRTIYDQHDVAPAMASARPRFGALRGLFELFERLTVRAAHAVLTTSEEQARRLGDRYGIDATIVRSSTHGAGPAAAAARRSGAQVRLGYLGVVGEQEGLEDLLDAVAKVRADGRDEVTVAIAGDGPYLPAVRRHAERLGLGAAVTFEGWLQGSALEEFLAGLDAMVVSDPGSEYNHHCAMNKVMEAMARGLPLIMRPLRENLNLAGDHPWVARGWAIDDLAQAIVAFADADADLRRAEGVALRERYESDLAWPDHARRYLAAVVPG